MPLPHNRKLRNFALWLLFLYFINTSSIIWAQNFDPIVPGLQLSVEIPDGVATEVQFAELVKKASQEALQNQPLESYFDRHFEATGAYGQLNNGTLAEDWDNLAKAFGLSVTTLLGAYALWRRRKRAEIESLISGDDADLESWLDDNLDIDRSLTTTENPQGYSSQVITKDGTLLASDTDWTNFLSRKGLSGVSGFSLWALVAFWRRKKQQDAHTPDKKYAEIDTILAKYIQNKKSQIRSFDDFYSKSSQEVQSLVNTEKERLVQDFIAENPEPIAPQISQLEAFILEHGYSYSHQFRAVQSQIKYHSYNLGFEGWQAMIQKIGHQKTTAYYYQNNPGALPRGYDYIPHLYHGEADTNKNLFEQYLTSTNLSKSEQTQLRSQLQTTIQKAYNESLLVSPAKLELSKTDQAQYKKAKIEWKQALKEHKSPAQETLKTFSERVGSYRNQAVAASVVSIGLNQGAHKIAQNFKDSQRAKHQDHQPQFTTQLTQTLENFSWDNLEALKSGTYEWSDERAIKIKNSIQALESGDFEARKAFTMQFYYRDFEAQIKEKEAYIYKELTDPYQLQYKRRTWYWPNINKAKSDIINLKREQQKAKILMNRYDFGEDHDNIHLYEAVDWAQTAQDLLSQEVTKSTLTEDEKEAYWETLQKSTTDQTLFWNNFKDKGAIDFEDYLKDQSQAITDQYKNQIEVYENILKNLRKDIETRYSWKPWWWRNNTYNDFNRIYTNALNNIKNQAGIAASKINPYLATIKPLADQERSQIEILNQYKEAATKDYQIKRDKIATQKRVLQFTRQLEHLGKDNDYFGLGYEHLGEIIEINDQISKTKNQIPKAETTRERYGLEDQLKALQEKKETLTQDLFNLKSVADGLIDIDFVDEPVIEDWESAQSSYYERLLEKNPVYQYLQEREKQKAFYAKHAQSSENYDFETLAEGTEAYYEYYNDKSQTENLTDANLRAVREKAEAYTAYRNKQLPKKMIWYPWNNRSGKSYAYIEDYKDAKWEQLHMDYYRQANIYNNSQRTQEAKEAIEAYRIELEDRRRAQWETSHAVDLSTKFTAEQLESYETLKSEWTRTQAAETVTVQKEVVVKVPAQTKSSSKKVKLHPVSVAKEVKKPLEIALKESTYEDYAKVFGEELTAAQSGALVGALAALNLPIEPEMPEGAQDYLELSLKTDKVRNTMETQDKDLRNTVIRRQKLEAQIKSLTTKAMDSYDAWRSTGTNKNYNNYLRYNTELREKKGLLKDLQSYEAELRTTLHTTQDQFNDLQASLGRETTKFARYDNLLTTYKKEQTAYEKRKAEITASVAEKYDYLRAKAQTYYQAAQTTDDEPLVAFIEADLTQDQEEVYIPASEQIVIEAREIPKDLYELSNLVAMGGMGIGGKSSIDTSNPFWTNKVISQFKEGNIDALLLSDLSFDDQKSLLDAAESHRELADILQKEEDEIIELLIRAISKNLNDHPLYFPMRDIAAAVYDLKDQVGTYKKMDPKNYGLLTEDLINTETGFQAAIYSNGENTVVAFAGTQDSKDWDDNIAQSIGLDSAQYKAAKDLAEKIKANLTNQKLIFTGHSLGGGLAALAGASTGATTLTFNAAGIHKKTLDKAEVFNKNFENITNYATRRDILTDIQENINLGPISFLAPNALGKQVKKSGSGLLQYLPSIFSPTPLKIYNGIQQHSNF